MAIKYVGRAAVWGLNATVAGSSLGTILIQSYKFKPSADQVDLMEKTGTEGRICANPHETLTIEGIYTGSSVSDAKTQAAKTPSIGDKVTVTDAEDTEIAGDWIISDAEKSAETKGPKQISITCDRFPDASAFTTAIT